MIQDTVFVITLLLMAGIFAGFAYVAINASGEAEEYAPLQAKSYRVRSKFFWALVIAGIIITVITTLDLPFAATRGDMSGVSKEIDVEGRQWYWQLSDTSAAVGATVVFNVKAGDVTHGLGVYDPNMHLIGQTQAMPGYENSLKLTFDKPGTYKLLCMEYCGLAHHAMTSDFTVTAE